MKISVLKDRVYALVMVLGLALLASLNAGNAYADVGKIDAAATAKGMADTPALVAAGKIPCEVKNAYSIGQTNITKDGKSVKSQTYEVACKSGPGWMITSSGPGMVEQPYNCTIGASYKKTHPEVIQCVLPENTPHYAWMTDAVKAYVPGCTVNNGRLIGSTSTDPKIDRYEFGCAAGPGGVLDMPQIGSTASTEYRSCLMEEGSNSACQYTTKDQIMTALKPIAATASKACVVSDVRFVGVTKESDGYYYEFGCSNQPGFIVLTTISNAYSKTVPCVSAAGLGGCKFTNAGAAAADQNTGFTNQLKAAGYTCTVKDNNVVGTQAQTKRDYIEFKCPEQPWGLIGLVPQADSTAHADLHDCFIESGRSHPFCSLTTKDVLVKQIDALIKLKEPTKGCDVKDVRFVGESETDDGAEIIEIACVNKRGYIAVIAKDRKSLLVADPCRLAASHKDAQKCTIPENGTYAE